MFEHVLGLVIDIWGFGHQKQSFTKPRQVEENKVPSELLLDVHFGFRRLYTFLCIEGVKKQQQKMRPLQSSRARTRLLNEFLRAQCFPQLLSVLFLGFMVKALACQISPVKRFKDLKCLYCIQNICFICLKRNRDKINEKLNKSYLFWRKKLTSWNAQYETISAAVWGSVLRLLPSLQASKIIC